MWIKNTDSQAENMLTTFSKIVCLCEMNKNLLFLRDKLKFSPHDPWFDPFDPCIESCCIERFINRQGPSLPNKVLVTQS